MPHTLEREYVSASEVAAAPGATRVRGDEIRRGDEIWTEQSLCWHRVADFNGQHDVTPDWVGLVFADWPNGDVGGGMIIKSAERYWVRGHDCGPERECPPPFVTDRVEVTYEDTDDPNELVIRVRNIG
jgi:hypothetical protein